MRRWTVTFKASNDVEISVTLNAEDIFKAIEMAHQYYADEDWIVTDVTSWEN